MVAIVLAFSIASYRSSPVSLVTGGDAPLSFELDPLTLTYTVTTADGEVSFTSHGAEDNGFAYSANGKHRGLLSGLVQLGDPTPASGSDATGTFTSLSINFTHKSSEGVVGWVATVKAYTNRSALVFAQRWPRGGRNTTGGSTFPSLKQAVAPKGGVPQLGTLEYTGASCGFMVSAKGEFPGIVGGAERGYIVIAPRDVDGTGASTTLAIGPVTEHFANQARSSTGASLTYGVAPTFETLPAGFTVETVLVASGKKKTMPPHNDDVGARASITSGGVNAALMEFGDFLLTRHGKTRARGDIKRETEYIGYSTTAFYFYNLCDCLDEPVATPLSKGKPDPHNRKTCERSPIPSKWLHAPGIEKPGHCGSYADTLLAANAALEAQGIPIQHFLLDSWWYGEGWNGGASLWEDVPQCTGNDSSLAPRAYPAATFPNGGLKAFRAAVGAQKTIWTHNGLWTATSPYRDRYAFAANEPLGPPQGDGLWQHLFSANAKWGLSTIKQDHIRQQVAATKSSYTNATVLKSWMAGLGDGASANGIGVLYCCAEPNIHMNGVTVPAAYAVRSSPDYVAGHGLQLPTVQWAIGPDAAFHWNGLGLLPYKDTFLSNRTSAQRSGRSWTTDDTYFPSFSGYVELGAATHALMSLLSMAHVTFSDAVGETNKTLIDQLIRADGMLLKADRPVTAIDAQFQAMMFGQWPGEKSKQTAGSLYTMPCDKANAAQSWSWTHANATIAAAAAAAGGHNKAAAVPPAGFGTLTVAGGGGGCLSAGDDCNTRAVVGTVVRMRMCEKTCPSQQFLLAPHSDAPKNGRQYALQLGGTPVNASSKSLCVQLVNGGGALFECDTGAGDQGWLIAQPSTSTAVGAGGDGGDEGDAPFTLRTPSHDDGMCLTATPLAAQRGAFSFANTEERDALASELFPSSGGSYSPLSAQYRDAYTMSAGLLRSIEARQKRDGEEQCAGGRPLGSPQGPLGEVYSTHATVSGKTWRYVVGVQLPVAYSVTPYDVNLDVGGKRAAAADADAVPLYVSYAYDHAKPGFRPAAASDLVPIAAGAQSVLTLRADAGEMCETRPSSNQTTRCYGFQLHAIAPVSSNGWALLGETGKFVPVSQQRIASVAVVASGGFDVAVKGKAGERVELGAVDVDVGGVAPVYVGAVIGAGGTAVIQLR